MIAAGSVVITGSIAVLLKFSVFDLLRAGFYFY